MLEAEKISYLRPAPLCYNPLRPQHSRTYTHPHTHALKNRYSTSSHTGHMAAWDIVALANLALHTSSLSTKPTTYTYISKKIYNFCFSKPFHPHSAAIISAARSPIPRTVNMGFTVGISGNTPASAILTPLSPLSLNSGSTTANSSLATSPIFVVPAGWYTV